MKTSNAPSAAGIWLLLALGCIHLTAAAPAHGPGPIGRNLPYPGVPISSVYAVSVFDGKARRELVVFESSCPRYRPGYRAMKPVDQYPLKLFKGRSISWTDFSLSNPVTVRVRVLDAKKVLASAPVKILPARYGIQPSAGADGLSFTLSRPGQYSVEFGTNGCRNGLLIFADPPETNRPDPAKGGFYELDHATAAAIQSVPGACRGIWFKPGVHDIGVYHVPAHIKTIYFAPGSWVYGALVVEGNSGVKIFGRGVLSGAHLNYRQAHAVEALDSDRVDLEGIVLADTKFYAVRLLGSSNAVRWVKIVGGWTYNTDGIAAFAGSTIDHCFIWANDDSLKPYRSDLRISDCTVWQLNNGAVIQLGWGNAKATNVVIRDLDILHAEWNHNAVNRGILSCVGDKFARGGMAGWQQSFLIEDVVTETPVPFIFNVRPSPASPDGIQGMVFRNWNVNMDRGRGYANYIECADPARRFGGFVFDHFVLNGVTLTESNWIRQGRFVIKNLAPPGFPESSAAGHRVHPD